jgi:hypothetical protein
MSGNKLLLATAVLAALLAVTVLMFNARDAEDQRGPDVSIKLPKVKKEDVDELTISAPEKPTFTFKKVDDKHWDLTAPVKALADTSAVDTALLKLTDLEVIGVAATKADNHDKLEVSDGKAVHVLAKQKGKPLADLLIGTYRGGNTMVRLPGSDNVATVKGSIKYAFEKDTKDWRDRQVVDVTLEQVTEVTFDNARGKFHFIKTDGAWKQAPGDKPIPNFESGKIVSLVGTATTMRANDFGADAVTPDAAGVGAKPDGTVTLKAGTDAGDQTVVLYVGHKVGEGYYLRREGKEALFIVSPFAGERMLSGPDKFVKDDPKTAEANKVNNKIEVNPIGHSIHPVNPH